jgi:hypothetical protein
MTKSVLGKACVLTFVGLAAFMIGGCNKFTMQRFDTMVYNGQTQLEVEKVLGEPWQKTPDMWYYRNNDNLDSAKIKFDSNGRVMDKQWDGRDVHPDAKPGAMDHSPAAVEVETTEIVTP